MTIVSIVSYDTKVNTWKCFLACSKACHNANNYCQYSNILVWDKFASHNGRIVVYGMVGYRLMVTKNVNWGVLNQAALVFKSSVIEVTMDVWLYSSTPMLKIHQSLSINSTYMHSCTSCLRFFFSLSKAM